LAETEKLTAVQRVFGKHFIWSHWAQETLLLRV